MSGLTPTYSHPKYMAQPNPAQLQTPQSLLDQLAAKQGIPETLSGYQGRLSDD